MLRRAAALLLCMLFAMLCLLPSSAPAESATYTTKNNKVVQKHYAKVMELFYPTE